MKKKILMLMFLTFSVFIGMSNLKAYELGDANTSFSFKTNKGTLSISKQELINVNSDFANSKYIIITKSNNDDSVDIIGVGRAGILYDEDKISITYKTYYSSFLRYS